MPLPGGPNINDYLAILPSETEEQRFLRSIPWTLDAGPQDPESLIQSLRQEAQRLVALPKSPVFSLVTPMYNTPIRLLRELILSVRCQSYPHWELILVDDGSPNKEHLETAREWAAKDSRIRLFAEDQNRGISGARNVAVSHAQGGFIAILDHDDLLHPMALGYFARVVNDDPDVNFVFSNECQIDDKCTRTYGYFYKPQFDLFTLLRANYICHFTAIRRDLLMAARRDGRVFRTEFDGAEDHDLFARIGITGQVKAHHIPLFLYYWRAVPTSCSMSLDAKPEIPERRLCLLDELLPQVYPNAKFRFAGHDPTRGECHLTIRIRSLGLDTKPTLRVIVPLEDHSVQTVKCLASIEHQIHDLDIHVILADPGTLSPGTSSAIRDWLAQPRSNRYEMVAIEGRAHLARSINTAVSNFSEGNDLILVLRHDHELQSPDAIQTLAMQLIADPSSGVLGLKITATDHRHVRHAGIKLFESTDGSGYPMAGVVRHFRDYVNDEHLILGVSLSCAMFRRETFQKLGGLDEVTLTGAYADLDFCIRAIKAGYRNYYFGTLSAIDHGIDRGFAASDREFERAALWERHGQTLSNWRLRMLTHTLETIWPTASQTVVPQVIETVAEPSPIPVRYKVADKMNSAIKFALGPLHGLLKRGLTGSWRAARAVGRPVKRLESIYRPNFRRDRPRVTRD